MPEPQNCPLLSYKGQPQLFKCFPNWVLFLNFPLYWWLVLYNTNFVFTQWTFCTLFLLFTSAFNHLQGFQNFFSTIHSSTALNFYLVFIIIIFKFFIGSLSYSFFILVENTIFVFLSHKENIY